jgi:hypothetical protein
MNIRTNKVAEEHQSLWLMAASPTIWAIHLLLSYITAAIWCGMIVGPYGPLATARIAIAVYTVVALVGIGSIGAIGLRRHRLGVSAPPHDADTPEDRHRFIGFSTFLLSGMSAVAVGYAALAAVFIETCQ